jgi:hypothetical protein
MARQAAWLIATKAVEEIGRRTNPMLEIAEADVSTLLADPNFQMSVSP